MTRRILIGCDGSERDVQALALGRLLADAAGEAEVVVVHVYEQLSPKSTLDDERPAQARRRQAAEALLANASALWTGSGRVSREAVCANAPAVGLHRLASDRGADVIVVGSSHRTGLGRVWPGSVTERTLHGAPCAVAVAPPAHEDATDGTGARHIGVAFDGSSEARAALEPAAALARSSGARLVLVQVVDVGVSVPMALEYAGYVREQHAVARAQLRAAATSVHDVVVEQRQVEGRPVAELIAVSRGLDLLVLGSRGYGPLRRLMLGAVSAPVVRGAHCPVLVLPRPARHSPDADDATTDRPVTTSTHGSI